MIELLLASHSPRRRQLLGELGYKVSFVDLDVEEKLDSPLPPEERAEALACLKSQAYGAELLKGQVLVAADTVVVHCGEAMGKPRNRKEAQGMLQRLAGDVHQVYTGVCLRNAERFVSFTERTDVHFRQLGQAEIAYYIDHFKPYDKAGAYGIQEWIGMVAVERIEGCYYNVMGLPLSRLYKELQRLAVR
ncbi:MAG: Maf family nucleotide pyrophosphatase [Bacteroidales bacterium]|nr:Maf family nucleotide pyrophosphatase [Bacteroidales bacterium]